MEIFKVDCSCLIFIGPIFQEEERVPMFFLFGGDLDADFDVVGDSDEYKVDRDQDYCFTISFFLFYSECILV